MTDRGARSKLPHGMQPRGLARDAAAAYIGVGTGTFDDMVAAGLMPASIPLPFRRRVWDVRKLDIALDRLGQAEEPSPHDDNPTTRMTGADECEAAVLEVIRARKTALRRAPR